MNGREKAIDIAKKSGARFVNIDGVIFEVYRAEYLPDQGERAWFADPIKIYPSIDNAREIRSSSAFTRGFEIKIHEENKEELLADAMRYRWLRDYALEVLIPGPVVCGADKWGELATVNGKHITSDGHDLDAEIDKAMSEFSKQR
jgi:hypothetical protein